MPTSFIKGKKNACVYVFVGKKKWSLLFRTFKPGNYVFHKAIEWPSSGQFFKWPQPGADPSFAFQRPDKTAGGHGVAQGGSESQTRLALRSDPSCSGLCPLEFWNLPRRESAQQIWARCVTASCEVFSHGRRLEHISTHSLCCACHALLKSLVALGDRLMHTGSQVMGPLCGHLFPGLSQPHSHSHSSGHHLQPLSILGPCAQPRPFLSICFVLRGPKMSRISRCGQMNGGVREVA